MTVEHLTETVNDYLRLVAAGDAQGLSALFTNDATVEDPVGGPVQTGRRQILEFLSNIDGVRGESELLALRVAGGEVAFHFRLTTVLNGSEFTIAPIDVMTFDDEGKICSMKAYWSAED